MIVFVLNKYRVKPLRFRPHHLVAETIPEPTYRAQMANEASTGLTITFLANRTKARDGSVGNHMTRA